MRQAVERWLHTTHARLRRLPALSADAAATPIPPRRDQAFRRTGPERAARAESSTRWQARYEEVRHRHGAGETLLAISRVMGLARATVRKFVRAESLPARLPRGPGPSILDPWLLVQPVTGLKAADAAAVARVEQDKEAGIVAGLARRFTALVRACGVRSRQGSDAPPEPAAELDRWLAEAGGCGVGTIETFAAGLEGDGAAVRAALTEPWSSGQAEGQVNRLKLLKRQSYGRTSFNLLRRRVLMAA
jgi:hypothetical protein